MSDIRTSALGGIPFGGNSGRPSSPQLGQPYFNGEIQRLELYTGSTYGWQNTVAETPGVTGYTGTILESNTTNTITITGTNFTSGAVASLIGNDGTEYVATTTTINNLTQIVATFGVLPGNKEPYDIRIANPSNLYGVYYDILTVNDYPAWNTSAGSLGTFNEITSISLSVSASDEEGSAITYSSSNLPSWLSLNSSTGALTGTSPYISSSTTYNFNITASDANNQSTSRAFSLTINASPSITAEVLLVGGGGAGGGFSYGGGGGAGGLVYYSAASLSKATTFSLSVGNGGSQNSNRAPQTSTNGGNTSFTGLTTAVGGGTGGGDDFDGLTGGSSGGNSDGGAGGSGGATINPTSGQGNAGGKAGDGYGGAGGGGAGSAGSNSTNLGGNRNGGSGLQYSITGTAQWYAGGGGGSKRFDGSNGSGGSGIGGNGVEGGTGTSGAANTGSGGGGGSTGGAGGSGVIIIAYSDIIPALTISAGLTYDQPTRSGYRVYRFTGGSGTITI